jgi:hypothetical protein
LASAYTPAASQSPPPSNGALLENNRFNKSIVFPNSLSFHWDDMLWVTGSLKLGRRYRFPLLLPGSSRFGAKTY